MCYVQEIVGRMRWKKLVKRNKISSFVTISDEALTILAIDNSEFVWESQALNPARTPPSSKYTSKKPNRRLHEGWSNEGKGMFNVYFDKVKKVRDGDERKQKNNIFQMKLVALI